MRFFFGRFIVQRFAVYLWQNSHFASCARFLLVTSASLVLSCSNKSVVDFGNSSKRKIQNSKILNSSKTIPLILGHRGACGYRPEHTLASYELAINMGADYIEPDVVSTKDGVLVARHENEISLTTDVAVKFPNLKRSKVVDGNKIEGWFIEDLNLAELKTLRAKERLNTRDQSFNGLYEIPTIEEIIKLVQSKENELHRTIGIIPETKHPSYFSSLGLPLEKRLLELLKKYGYERPNSPIIIQSFEISNLERLHKDSPYKLMQLIDDPELHPFDQVLKNGGDSSKAIKYIEMLSDKGLESIKKYAQIVSPAKRMIVLQDPATKTLNAPNDLIDRSHRAGLLIMPYTFRNDKEYLAPEYNGNPNTEYIEFFDLGVDGLFTDFSGSAVQARLEWAVSIMQKDHKISN